jgi:hypothetical protein
VIKQMERTEPMLKKYTNLGGLSPAEFAAVMAHALLVVNDYLEGLGGYAECRLKQLNSFS